jgi:hypothetical protein
MMAPGCGKIGGQYYPLLKMLERLAAMENPESRGAAAHLDLLENLPSDRRNL